MKKTKMLLFAAVVFPLILSAQNQRPDKRGLENRPNRPEMPSMDLDREPDVEPSGKMDVDEFLLKRNDLKGKVVELTFDKVVSVKQAKEGYVAVVTYKSPRLTEGVTLIVPEGGLEFFEDLNRPELRRTESVYVHVFGRGIRALGTRYSGSKPQSERYSW